MASSNSEYRGEPLKELAGKTHFMCEICMRRVSIDLDLSIHHIRPQAFFPKGSTEVHARSNLACLCNSCHTSIHRLGSSLAGSSADKKSAYDLANDFAIGMAIPERVSEVASNLLKYAVIVAQSTVLKRDKGIAGNDVDTILTLPPQFNTLLKILSRTVKDSRGRVIGKERLVALGVLQLLGSRFPEKKQEIDAYIFAEILKAEKPSTQTPVFMSAQRL
jgi:hypothetical protein